MVFFLSVLPLLGAYQDEVCSSTSCKNHCGSPANQIVGGCLCDEACTYHGDCCMDYLAECTNTTYADTEDDTNCADKEYTECVTTPYPDKDDYMFALRNKSMGQYMTCIDMSQYGEEGETRMIAKCPENYETNPKILCENVSLGGLQGQVPVFDHKTQLLFRNKFCADCHGYKEIEPLNPHFVCRNSTEAVKIRLNGGFNAFVDYAVAECLMAFDWWDISLHELRETCNDNVIENCPTPLNQNDYITSLNCVSYSAIVRGYNVQRERQTFKNHYCAMCNGFNGSLTCSTAPSTLGKPGPLHGVSSFSVIMDFSSTDGLSQQVIFFVSFV